jgi:hypothetical protein
LVKQNKMPSGKKGYWMIAHINVCTLIISIIGLIYRTQNVYERYAFYDKHACVIDPDNESLIYNCTLSKRDSLRLCYPKGNLSVNNSTMYVEENFYAPKTYPTECLIRHGNVSFGKNSRQDWAQFVILLWVFLVVYVVLASVMTLRNPNYDRRIQPRRQSQEISLA